MRAVTKNILPVLAAGLMVIALAVTNLALGPQGNAQATATLTLEPASSSVEVGNNLTVTIYTNSGNREVNAVIANLTYDTAKLQYLSTSISGTGFGSEIVRTGGNGTVSNTRFPTPPPNGPGKVSGKQKVVSVTFKTLSAGSTAVNFANSSVITSVDTNENVWNGNTTGGTYTITAPPSNPGGGGSGTGGGSNTGGGGGNKPLEPSQQPSDPSNPSPDNDNNTPDPNNNNNQPPQGDNNQTETPGEDETPAAAYMVAIKVTDREDNPVEGAEVELNGQTTTTDAEGIAGFFNITPGVYDVRITSKAGVLSASITVDDNASTSEVQLFDLRVEPAGRPMWLTVLLGAVVIGIIGAGAYFVYDRLRDRSNRPPSSYTTGGSGPSGLANPPSNPNPLDGISGPSAPPPGSVINAG